MTSKNLAITALFMAIAVLSAHLVYIPVGVAKCFPVQSAVNIILAVLLGTRYAVSAAFGISVLRNILGTGSLLAFPGSMIGAVLAGYLYNKTGRLWAAVLGEIVGTGILGSLLAFPVAKFILGSQAGAFFLVIPFMVSAVGGGVIAYLLCRTSILTRLQSRDKAKAP